MADRTAKAGLLAGLMLLLAAGGCQTPAGYVSAAGIFTRRRWGRRRTPIAATSRPWTRSTRRRRYGWPRSTRASASVPRRSPRARPSRPRRWTRGWRRWRRCCSTARRWPQPPAPTRAATCREPGGRQGDRRGRPAHRPGGRRLGRAEAGRRGVRAIAGAIGQAVIEDRQAAAVRQATIDAEPAVATLAAMRADVQVGGCCACRVAPAGSPPPRAPITASATSWVRGSTAARIGTGRWRRCGTSTRPTARCRWSRTGSSA